jgi:hypothetical protein
LPDPGDLRKRRRVRSRLTIDDGNVVVVALEKCASPIPPDPDPATAERHVYADQQPPVLRGEGTGA